ncbi:MAG: GatB/YqeY domain-containing protein [Pseudomonadota bacterium]
MSALRDSLNEAVKAAMRAGDKPRLGVLRQLSAALKQREIDERIELDDAAVTAILDKQAKQRRESIEQFTRADRTDLVDIERAELDVIQEFLPQPLGDAELSALVEQAIAACSASSMQDMGKVMGILKPQVTGRADMGALSATVRSRLTA